MKHNGRRARHLVSRRDTLRLGGAAIITAGLPASAASATEAAARVSDVLPVPAEIGPRLDQLRAEFIAAMEAYRLRGETKLVENLRLSARNKLVFSLGLQARNGQDRVLFREARMFLDLLETSFPNVPMSPEMSARYAKLRAWAQAGGQFNVRRRSQNCRAS